MSAQILDKVLLIKDEMLADIKQKNKELKKIQSFTNIMHKIKKKK